MGVNSFKPYIFVYDQIELATVIVNEKEIVFQKLSEILKFGTGIHLNMNIDYYYYSVL